MALTSLRNGNGRVRQEAQVSKNLLHKGSLSPQSLLLTLQEVGKVFTYKDTGKCLGGKCFESVDKSFPGSPQTTGSPFFPSLPPPRKNEDYTAFLCATVRRDLKNIFLRTGDIQVPTPEVPPL